MIRILHIVPDLCAASGIMSVVMNYYRFIDRSKIQFDFLYFEQKTADYEPEIRALGGRIYRIEKPGLSMRFLNIADCFFAEHEGEYRILHCHPIFASEVFGGAARCHGIRHVIQHSHSTRYSINRKAAIRNKCISLAGPLFITDYMACSPRASVLLGRRAARSGRVFILNNAIDCKKYRFDIDARMRIRKKHGIAEHTTVIGHTGRFAPEKNHLFLLDIFAAYHSKAPDSCLLLLGDGEQMPQVKEKACQLGVEDAVIFAGRRENVPDYLSAMDFFVFPSVYEGLSLALVEAQCSGLYCFVSDTVAPETRVSVRYDSFSLNDSPTAIAEKLRGAELAYDRYAFYDTLTCDWLDIEKEARKLEQYYLALT